MVVAGRFLQLRSPRDRQVPALQPRPRPGLPADLEVAYPENLSQGLVLVKWWLLAIPHYIIVGLFVGYNNNIGLIGILTVINGIILLFSGKLSEDIFKLVIGLDRWAYRVYTYAVLMTDKYPPFSLDD